MDVVNRRTKNPIIKLEDDPAARTLSLEITLDLLSTSSSGSTNPPGNRIKKKRPDDFIGIPSA